MKVTALTRVFAYAGVTLPDPAPSLSVDQVRDIYSATYPELATASVEGPETRDGKMVYTFRRSAGMKGSYCPRYHFVLPSDRCAEAVALYNLARDDAMRAKREIWHEKYGAAGAVTGAGTKGNGLIFPNYQAFKVQFDLGGLCKAERLKDVGEGWRGLDPWIGKPARNTKRGKAIAADLEYVEELLDIWQWSLEKALGIDGTVFHNHAFHKTVAHILPDGRVIVSAPEDLNRPCASGSTYGCSRNFDASKIPDWAQPISQAEYETLLAKSKSREEEAA